MKKYNVKKFVLYISFIPYIYAIVMSVFYAFFGYDYYGDTYYGLDSLSRFWSDIIFEFMITPKVVILAVCIIYQIYYFIMGKRKEKRIKQDEETGEEVVEEEADLKAEKRRKVLYIISWGCWGLYLLTGVYAFFFGYSTGIFKKTMIYVFEALSEVLFWNIIIFSVIPILPISTIYIVIYHINKLKNKKQ